jgi:uncharacterized protein with NAD-binding domain and iron-sulfur cluster
MAALAAAFELTSQPDWKEKYEVTVYQLGWRLGGKGASSRGQYGRIEEHGLHVWLGSYENAFRLIQRCYQELGRSLEEQLATWEEAFKPQNIIALDERVEGEHDPWLLKIPMRSSVPGKMASDSEPEPMMAEAILHGVKLVHGHFLASPHAEGRLDPAKLSLGIALWFAQRAHAHHSLGRSKSAKRHHSVMGWFLKWFRSLLFRKVESRLESHHESRRFFILIDFAVANILGVVRDDLIRCGVDQVDHLDYRDWLRGHGALDWPTLESVPVRVLYDLGFSYLDGDPGQPQFAAGAAIRVVMRMALYRGAFVWELQAGMGETIFAPLYQVLKARGVRFEFFHRVTELVPEWIEGKSRISEIKVARQVQLKDRAGGYDPLVSVNGLPCWPLQPRYEQLERGEELRQGGYNLESFWNRWVDANPDVRLKVGEDFDRVVLAISLGSFPYLCKQLRQDPAWRDMLDHVPTVQTQALQLWLKPDNAGLGWPYWKEGRYILDINQDPFDTWADMSHLLIRERWPGEHSPSSVHYFCSALPGPKVAPPPWQHAFPEQALKQVEQAAADLLKHTAPRIWPSSAAGTSGTFDWGLLVDPENRSGERRMKAQFFRANVDPSERYVYAAPGTLKYRMRSDQSGFDNLFLAGDWTRNGLNVGAMESAVMSGMQASRAICGHPEQIAFEKFADGLSPEDC